MTWRPSSSSSSSACPELERSGFHEVLPVFSILGASPSRVETMIMRLEICSHAGYVATCGEGAREGASTLWADLGLTF